MTVPAGPEANALNSGIVAVDELREHMGNPQWSDSQRANAAQVLLGVQDDLEDYLNRPLSPVQVREVVQCDEGGYVNARYAPVIKVISTEAVQQGFAALTSTQITVKQIVADDMADRIADFAPPTGTVIGNPLIVPGGWYVGDPGNWYLVEYIACYIGPLEKFKLAIKIVAARIFAPNNSDTINFREDRGETAENSDDRPIMWTEEELQQFDRARRRVIA